MQELKIGIMGGSFNPPHIGHLHAAGEFLNSVNLDKLLVIPAGIPPHKKLSGNADNADRLKMTELAFSGMERTEVSDIEINADGPSYTIDTLVKLKNLYKSARFYLFIGTDMFLSFEEWHRFTDIFGIATPVVIPRTEDLLSLKEKADYLTQKYGAQIILLKSEPVVVSSTSVRNEIKRSGESVYITPEVMRYIKDKRLYL